MGEQVTALRQLPPEPEPPKKVIKFSPPLWKHRWGTKSVSQDLTCCAKKPAAGAYMILRCHYRSMLEVVSAWHSAAAHVWAERVVRCQGQAFIVQALLARCVKSVLDLGCGDGKLLEAGDAAEPASCREPSSRTSGSCLVPQGDAPRRGETRDAPGLVAVGF